jgi:hypothetical protein
MIIHYDQQKNLHQDTCLACASLGTAKLFSADHTILVGRRILGSYDHGIVRTVGLICKFYLQSSSYSPFHALVAIIVLDSHHKSVYSSLLLLAIPSIFKDLSICRVHRLGICCSLLAWSCLSSIHSAVDGFLARPALSAEIHSPPQGLSLNRTLSAYLLFALSGQYLALALIFFLHHSPKDISK